MCDKVLARIFFFYNYHKILKTAPTTNYFSFHKSPAGHKMSPTSLLKPFSLYSQNWTRIGFRTIPNCDVNNHARRPASQNHTVTEHWENVPWQNCMWKQPSTVVLKTYTDLHGETQSFNCRNKKKDFFFFGLEGNSKSLILLVLCTDREFKWDS